MLALESAESHGLRGTDYGLDQLRQAEARVSSPEVDALAEQAFRAYANDLLRGRIDPLSIDPDWPYSPRQADINTIMNWALQSGDAFTWLELLAPRSEQYAALRLELFRWRSAAEADWPTLSPTEAPLAVGDDGERVRQVRARLIQMGVLPPFSPAVTLSDESVSLDDVRIVPAFDEEMQTTIQRIQYDARLEPDGLIGSETLAWLNRTPSDRIAVLRANLERLRWMPEDLGDVHISVNVPDFSLIVVESGQVIRRHNVIVGRRSRPTPVLTASLTHLIVNPWWETPHSLAVRDELPLFQRDPDAVARLGFQILDRQNEVVDGSIIDWSDVNASDFPYRLRQAPGPLNALGEVKFIFPNPHSTFLHDTPGRHRFEEMPRAFSSGCVRVEDARELAGWAIQYGVADPDRPEIPAIIETGDETRIDMSADIHVHFLYFTAFLDADGSVRMVHDLYEKDHRIIEALDAPQLVDETAPSGIGAEPRSGAGPGDRYACFD
ncbi:L,D-transpeptidase family protein [Hyphobacterium sp.]|uniref:L,D-transpeptidase family protein n=1 Tax=Hyphobacterium sp. TaxID=2004662 RepID=UPI003BAD7A34